VRARCSATSGLRQTTSRWPGYSFSQAISASPDRRSIFFTCEGSVFSSFSDPSNASIATGRPSLSHNRP
jgi:hypothetical protein